MRSADLREFAARPRDQIASAKRDYWRLAAQTGAGLAAFDAAQELYEHAKAVGTYPNAAYQADDLQHHVRLKKLIDRASQAAPFASAAR